MNSLSWDGGALVFSAIDRLAQEDSLKVDWRSGGPALGISTHNPVDLSRQTNAEMAITFYARNLGSEPAKLTLGLECVRNGGCTATVPVIIGSTDWKKHSIKLGCFAAMGIDMDKIRTGFALQSAKPASIGLSDIKIAAGEAGVQSCRAN